MTQALPSPPSPGSHGAGGPQQYQGKRESSRLALDRDHKGNEQDSRQQNCCPHCAPGRSGRPLIHCCSPPSDRVSIRRQRVFRGRLSCGEREVHNGWRVTKPEPNNPFKPTPLRSADPHQSMGPHAENHRLAGTCRLLPRSLRTKHPSASRHVELEPRARHMPGDAYLSGRWNGTDQEWL